MLSVAEMGRNEADMGKQAVTLPSGVVIPESGEVTLPSFEVLGIRVNPLQIPDILVVIDHWIQERKGCHVVVQTGMHGVSESLHKPELREQINRAALNNMDGTPMKWLARLHGFKFAKRRAYGPEVMEMLLKQGPKYSHFFYGNSISDKLAEKCVQQYGIRLAGTYPSPEWPVPEEERQNIARAIEAAKPDIVWCGLGGVRQESWMDDFQPRLTVPVLIGVGAAFDFHAGTLKQAPVWVQENGLEWLHRLGREPLRLWRRYLVNGPVFLWNVGLELTGLKKFS